MPDQQTTISFDPPLLYGSPEYFTAYEVMRELEISQKTVIGTRGSGHVYLLSVPCRAHAMILKLRL